LQNRAGTICARTGCDVDASAFATIAYSRALRVAAIHFPRAVSRLRTPISLLKHIGRNDTGILGH
jgi:hypothetical protein